VRWRKWSPTSISLFYNTHLASKESVLNPVYAYLGKVDPSRYYPKTWSADSMQLMELVATNPNFTSVDDQELVNALLRKVLMQKLKTAGKGAITIGIIACGVAGAVVGAAATGGATCATSGAMVVGKDVFARMLGGFATTLGKDLAEATILKKNEHPMETMKKRIELLETQRDEANVRAQTVAERVETMTDANARIETLKKLADDFERRLERLEHPDQISQTVGNEIATLLASPPASTST
jgi:glutamate synthase domain-containing protein 3